MPDSDGSTQVRRCPSCETPMVRHPNEHPASFKIRTYCSRHCRHTLAAHVFRSGMTLDAYLRTRFASKVDRSAGDDACWRWTGKLDNWGYGRFKIEGVGTLAHRHALRFSGVDVPHDKLVLHSCDNPGCVNPAHLRVGTDEDNSRDMVSRKRHVYGERARNAKLSEDKVRQIRDLGATGRTHRSLAAEFGVSAGVIFNILRRKKWKHVT